jgi:hypothetical protein
VGVIAVVSLVVALVALVLAGLVWRRTARRASGPLPTDVAGLRAEVAALRQEAGGALRHLAIVRYDAFGDMGGSLSWSLVLADDGGDGVVLTSIVGRSEARSYAKSLRSWASGQQLSPQEEQARDEARGSAQ